MAMKGCSTFPKAPALLEPHHQIVSCYIQDTHWGGGSYPSAEVLSVYSTAPADWAIYILIYIYIYMKIVSLLYLRHRESFYVTQFLESKAFAGEALTFGEISFLILLSLVQTSDIFSHLTLKPSIFIKDSSGNKHSWLANQ